MEKKEICSLFRVVSFVIMAFSTSIKLLKQGSCASSSHDERILKVVENIHLRIFVPTEEITYFIFTRLFKKSFGVTPVEFRDGVNG